MESGPVYKKKKVEEQAAPDRYTNVHQVYSLMRKLRKKLCKTTYYDVDSDAPFFQRCLSLVNTWAVLQELLDL